MKYHSPSINTLLKRYKEPLWQISAYYSWKDEVDNNDTDSRALAVTTNVEDITLVTEDVLEVVEAAKRIRDNNSLYQSSP